MCFVTLLIAAAAVSVTVVGALCPGADKCFDQSAYNQLSKSNAKDYCVKGAILVGQASACLDECNAKDDSGKLATAKTDINNFCKNSDPKCPNVCDEYINQTKCFDPYGGRDAVTGGVLDTFDATATRNASFCQKLSWSRYCQKETSCSFNVQLDLELMRANRPVMMALSICGSESLSALAAQITDNSLCKTDSDTTAQSTSNIACDVASAENPEDICKALEKQAKNLELIATGCFDRAQQYLLPRMLTYAIANEYLKCQVRQSGLKVQPIKSVQLLGGLANQCNYSNVLNSCFYARTVDNAIDWNRLKPLINGDMPIGDFCKNDIEKASALSQCEIASIACAPPQQRLLTQSASYDDDYVAKLGTFPLNAYGMSTVFKEAAKVCSQKATWTTPLCDPQALKEPVVTTVKPTQQPRSTPPGKVPIVARNENDADDFKESKISDEGSKIVVSFALFGFSMLMALFATM
jgi:hypothetical protein